MPPEIKTFIAGTALGLVCPLVTFWVQQSLRLRYERMAMTAAIVSEINSIVHLVDLRQYIPRMKMLLKVATENADQKLTHSFTFSVRRNPFSVFDANLSKLGIMDPLLAKQIVQFYSQASAALEDIKDMAEGKNTRTGAANVQFLNELINLFEGTINLGREIVAGSGR